MIRPPNALGAALASVLLVAAAARADEPEEPRALAARIDSLQLAHDEVEARRAALDGEAQEAAREIERLKGRPEGLGRDVRLGQLLAASQERAARLERLAAELRAREAELSTLRHELVESIDRALGRAAAAKASAAERATLGELRAKAIAHLPAPGAVRLAPETAIDPLAGPDELAERADRLQDDQEKLRREAERLERRIARLDERRRLRERAGALEDDLFVESGVGRRRLAPVAAVPAREPGTTSSDAAGGAQAGFAAGAPSANTPNASPSPGRTGTAQTPSPPTASGGSESVTVLVGVLDPATLDELRRAEGGGDPEGEIRALRRAEGDLAARAAELARREAALRKRAAELRRTK